MSSVDAARQTFMVLLCRVRRGYLKARLKTRTFSYVASINLRADFTTRPQVKRIVITSSCAAVLKPKPRPATFSEADWNDEAIKEVEEKGMKTHPLTIYMASKTLAEKCTSCFCLCHPMFICSSGMELVQGAQEQDFVGYFVHQPTICTSFR